MDTGTSLRSSSPVGVKLNRSSPLSLVIPRATSTRRRGAKASGCEPLLPARSCAVSDPLEVVRDAKICSDIKTLRDNEPHRHLEEGSQLFGWLRVTARHDDLLVQVESCSVRLTRRTFVIDVTS